MMHLKFRERDPSIEQRVDYQPLIDFYKARGLDNPSSDASSEVIDQQRVLLLANELERVLGSEVVCRDTPLNLAEIVFKQTCEKGEIKVVKGKLHYVPPSERK